MNINELEKKCPKAIFKYFDWLVPEEQWSTSYRDCYDFFDEQGIYIRVKTPFEHAYLFTKTFLFGWFIQIPPNKSTRWKPEYIYEYYEETSIYTSRKEAEQAAFEKAFEILENML